VGNQSALQLLQNYNRLMTEWTDLYFKPTLNNPETLMVL